MQFFIVMILSALWGIFIANVVPFPLSVFISGLGGFVIALIVLNLIDYP